MWILAAVTEDPLLQLLASATAPTILAFLVLGFLRGWIVSGSRYDRDVAALRAERDRALDLVYRQAGLANRAVEITAARLELEQEILKLRKEADDAPLP